MSQRSLILVLLSMCVGAFPGAVRGQSSTPSTPANTSNVAAPSPAKKVWTNDDVGDLRHESVISTVGDASSKPSTDGQKALSKGKDAKWYREQINKLEGKIPPLDDQIAALQAAIDGKPTGDARESSRPRGVKADSWTVEKDALQKQRGGVLSQINALYDEARHNGIPDSALPLQP